MMSYLGGKNYDVMLKCLMQEGKFTAFDIDEHPRRVKKLADGGMLDVVDKHPYSYLVPRKVKRRFQERLDS